jgi:Big-like domain-containing protein
VFDREGNSAVYYRRLIADNKKPTVRITKAPANGAKVKGTVKVSVAASDASGINRIELWINGKIAAKDVKSPYAFTINVAKYGKRLKVEIRAVDKAGNIAKVAVRTWHR